MIYTHICSSLPSLIITIKQLQKSSLLKCRSKKGISTVSPEAFLFTPYDSQNSNCDKIWKQLCSKNCQIHFKALKMSTEDCSHFHTSALSFCTCDLLLLLINPHGGHKYWNTPET